jgi:hypothetical protein
MRWLANLAVVLALFLASSAVVAQTAIRPDQICPGGACATPDITWGPTTTGTPGYTIGSTVAWRTSASATPIAITALDLGRVVELIFNGSITQLIPQATGSFGDGAGFTIQVGPGSLTLTATTSTINGIPGATGIKVGPYQSIGLMSKNGNWYGVLSVPQPTTQTGTTVLGDQMTWGVGGAGPTVCAEATAFLARVNTAGSTLDTAHSDAYKTLICDLKNDASGVWATLDALYIFATQDQIAAKLNLVSVNFSPVTLSATAPGWVANAGYTGVDNSTTVYIDTGYNAVTSGGHYAANNAASMAWSFTGAASAAAGVLIGNFDGTNISQTLPNLTGSPNADQCSLQVGGGGAATTPSSSTTTGALGSWICSRTSSTSLTLYKNGSSIATQTGAAGGAISNTIYILGRHDPSGGNAGAGRQVPAASIGSGLNAAQALALHTKVCAYLTLAAIHGSC